MTLHDLTEELKKLGEITLLEVLEISSEDILLRFPDKVEEKYDELIEEFSEGEEDERETE